MLIQAAAKVQEVGSCITCILTLNGSENLRAACVGSSGFMLLRPNREKELEKIGESLHKFRKFNSPYQIGTNGDSPKVADTYTIAIRHNDIVVLGTDGLWDNLYEEDIKSCFANSMEDDGTIKNLDQVAKSIGKLAFEKSNLLYFFFNSNFLGIICHHLAREPMLHSELILQENQMI